MVPFFQMVSEVSHIAASYQVSTSFGGQCKSRPGAQLPRHSRSRAPDLYRRVHCHRPAPSTPPVDRSYLLWPAVNAPQFRISTSESPVSHSCRRHHHRCQLTFLLQQKNTGPEVIFPISKPDLNRLERTSETLQPSNCGKITLLNEFLLRIQVSGSIGACVRQRASTGPSARRLRDFQRETGKEGQRLHPARATFPSKGA